VAHKIERITQSDNFPKISNGKIAVYIGSHLRFSQEETNAIERFCESYNASVFTDITPNYNGKYKVVYDIAACQRKSYESSNVDLLIHIGDMSDNAGMVRPKEVWRVSQSGEIQDRYKKLSYVFEMPEQVFFEHYANDGIKQDCTYYQSCMEDCKRLWGKIPELPFSHIWIASQLYDKLPKQSILHLGILSPLRSWSYFNIDSSIEVYCNQGGFGIDGNMSSMIGASIVAPEKLFFAVVGDLSFFYDMNSIGNRHIDNNVRILLVNNALGAEFHMFKQINSIYVNDIPKYLSAGGHFGRKSPCLVKHYAEDLGFEYLSAANKEEFLQNYLRFTTPEIADKPMLYEVFTEVEDEDKALWEMWHIEEDHSLKGGTKKIIKNVLGDKTINKIKGVVGK